MIDIHSHVPTHRDAVPPDELIGASVYDVLPDEVAEQLLTGIQRAIDTGEIVTGEYQLELGGEPRDFEARIVKAGDEAVLIGREFTERNRAQAELERLHAELTQRHRDLEHERDFIRTVVDSTPSLLCLATPGGFIVRTAAEGRGEEEDEASLSLVPGCTGCGESERDVAQPGSAPDWGSGGRGFESRHPDHTSPRFH